MHPVRWMTFKSKEKMKIRKVILLTLILINACTSIVNNEKELVQDKESIKFLKPEWSQDGKKIAFQVSKDKELNLYIIDNNGKNLEKIDSINSFNQKDESNWNSYYYRFINWFNDKNIIIETGSSAFDSGGETIYNGKPKIINIETKKITEVPKYTFENSNEPSIYNLNDKLILRENQNLFVFNLDGKLIDLTNNFDKVISYKLLPESSKILILGKNKTEENYKLFTVDLTEINPKITSNELVTQNFVNANNLIKWSLNGSKIAYIVKKSNYSTVEVYNFENNELLNIDKKFEKDKTITYDWTSNGDKLIIINESNIAELKYELNIYDTLNKNINFIEFISGSSFLQNGENIIFRGFNKTFELYSLNVKSNEKKSIYKNITSNKLNLYQGVILNDKNTIILPNNDQENSINLINIDNSNAKILSDVCGYDWNLKQEILAISQCKEGIIIIDSNGNKISNLIN